MKIEEYREALDVIEQRRKRAKNVLHKQYANENNTVKVGDIISDGTSTGKVLEMKITLLAHHETPAMVYTCELLKKNGDTRKQYKTVLIHQGNFR